jgi:hypothetical protein
MESRGGDVNLAGTKNFRIMAKKFCYQRARRDTFWY